MKKTMHLKGHPLLLAKLIATTLYHLAFDRDNVLELDVANLALRKSAGKRRVILKMALELSSLLPPRCTSIFWGFALTRPKLCCIAPE